MGGPLRPIERTGGAGVGTVPTDIEAITLFIEDVQRSKDFYSEVFGAEVIHQEEVSVVFKFQNTVINLLKESAAPDLIAPVPVADRASGSRYQFTLGVENVDATCAELETHGVKLLNGPMDRPWGIRTASFTDPDGHIWEIAGRLSRDGD
jgi:catechol 2,3-dioxygenase-like lactoylglutathione lyase family enzyme